jgi:hypothetical protein
MSIINGILTISTINAQEDRLIVNSQDGVDLVTPHDTPARFIATYNGDTKKKPKVELHAVRGTIENPEVLRPGDFGVKLNFSTYFELNGRDIGKTLATFIPQMDPEAVADDNAPASNLALLVNAGDGKGDLLDDYMLWAFRKTGALDSKIFQCVEQDSSSIKNIEPKNGMLIYNNETHKFQGFANGVWVDLH